MANLTGVEKRRLEKLLEMSSGYVLNFSNRTFDEFVLDTTGKDIYDSKYDYGSGSKANRLRGFWSAESSYYVGQLIRALVEYAEELHGRSELSDECRKIATRLLQESPVQEIDAIEPNEDGRDFEMLARAVRNSIETNEPEAGLDRLHTFLVRYVRVLCRKRGIEVTESKPLHSLFGEYVKALKSAGAIESQMAERILRSTISILDAFNDVRNNQSFAHDNPILKYDEALLIFNNVASAIRFLGSVEGGLRVRDEPAVLDNGLPFSPRDVGEPRHEHAA